MTHTVISAIKKFRFFRHQQVVRLNRSRRCQVPTLGKLFTHPHMSARSIICYQRKTEKITTDYRSALWQSCVTSLSVKQEEQ